MINKISDEIKFVLVQAELILILRDRRWWFSVYLMLGRITENSDITFLAVSVELVLGYQSSPLPPYKIFTVAVMFIRLHGRPCPHLISCWWPGEAG